jgi:quercetin dioxygenase-like cupin family protein
MKSRSRLLVVLAAFVVGAAITVGSVYAITIEVPARGTFASHEDKTNLLRGVARLQGEGKATDAAVQRIQLNPGEGPSWHTHAGPVTVIIKSGSFTVVQSDCSSTTYTAGQVFVDKGFGNVHRAYNPGPGTTEVWAVYVIPKDAGLIIPTTTPECAA